MNSLVIDSGAVEIEIRDGNGERKGVLKFSPKDISFIEKYQNFLFKFEKEGKKYKELFSRDDFTESDTEEAFEKVKEFYRMARTEIDNLFGEGTSKMLFSEELNVGEYEQFLAGIAPYIKADREEMIEKYTPVRSKKKKAARK